MSEPVQQCRKCRGYTLTLRAGLCSFCVYTAYTSVSGKQEQPMAEAIGRVLAGLEAED